VLDATDGRLVAAVGLHRIAGGSAEVGAWCVAAERGRGVVADAVGPLCRWAFDAIGLSRLEWAAEVGNAASLQAALRCGFAFEGRRRASLARRGGGRADGWWAARVPADGPDGAPPALPEPGVLTVGDLVLRRWRPADAGPLALAVDGATDALPPRPDVDSDEHARWWTAERSQEDWASGDCASLAVLGPGGQVVGSLQLFRKGRREGVAEVGIWVAPSARRSGVAGTAIPTMLDWAEPALRLARVEWHAAPDNDAALGLAARLGFVREGIARAAFPAGADGLRGDDVVLARLVQ